ncbi:heterokaryon incompatibility protein-domain-containing protein [Cubamyces menziesii]|nr:heterokaryon incompatibility protein-domain-containing protein [Cubamyces menziesii]
MALPPRWPQFCATAWEGIIASQYGLFHDPVEEYEDEDGNRLLTGGYEYTVSSVEWLKCAQAGCPWCRFLAKTFLGKLKDWPEWPFDTMHIRVGPWQIDYRWEERGPTTVIVINGLAKMFVLHSTEGNPAARWIKNRFLIPHVGWPYALAEAKACIEECVRDHPECRAITPYPIGDAPLPTRLIDCSDPDRLRIVETNSSVRGTYIALSYVWGEDQPHRTTELNLFWYKLRIDPAELPQTILDAIHVTRALGIDLLWVDGLCIVQDSDQDMHHELARMRDVYRNAYLTIDARSAAKVSEGFLQDRKLDPMPLAVLPFISPPGEPVEQPAGEAQLGIVYVTPAQKHTEYYTYGSFGLGDPDNHTGHRGWCLQERLLSTRMLVFNSKTLQLRCHTRTHNVGGARHYGDHDAARIPDAVFHPDRHIARHSGEWKAIHTAWLKIVEDYARAKLTNPADKLIAISAVAEMFAPILGPEYIAGLWRPSLLHDLLWYSVGNTPRRRPTGYRGPSWSWASTDRSVTWEGINEHADWWAEVVKCTVTLKSEQLPFGPVIGASLILRLPILPCKWLVDQDVDGPTPMQRLSDSRSERLVTRLRLSIDYSFPAPFALFRGNFEIDGDPSLSEVSEVWFVPLAIKKGGGGSSRLQGLAVTRVDPDIWPRSGEQGQGDVYRRVAITSCYIIWDRYSFKHAEGWDQLRAILSQLTVDIELV